MVRRVIGVVPPWEGDNDGWRLKKDLQDVWRRTREGVIVALFLVIVQTVVLIAGLALLGQFIVGMFNWARRSENFVYQLFGIVSGPLVRLVRLVTPRVVLDQHVPIVAFLFCVVAYFALGFAHRDVCLSDLSQAGCMKWVQARMR
jgi:uncharacterized protein YggT (Ycf19 family)